MRRPAAGLLWPALISLTAVGALRFESVQVPALVQRGASFWLGCRFQLDQELGERLYSVKWFRDGSEFYRLQLAAGADQPQQQQHFGAPGVNVLMSSSNATHVRLVNASLASEASYACEISTQNLSTIRYEREIRVYVPAQTRPAISGLKGRYALAEQVELICASDFSRPQPALAWFINGRLIRQDSRWFQVEAEQVQSNSLQAVRLRLRFKLSARLLESLLALDGHLEREPKRPALRLECRYRLADVAEVWFNELQVSLEELGGALNSQTGSAQPALRLERGNQLLQSEAPTSAAHLIEALAAEAANQAPSCGWLDADLPLLVSADSGPGVRLNCSTALALEPSLGLATCQRHDNGGPLVRAHPQSAPNQRPKLAPHPSPPSPPPPKPAAYLWLQKPLQQQKTSTGAPLSPTELGLERPTNGGEWVPRAPPLLEWFINNQEAPKSSVQYEPPLPVRAAPRDGGAGGQVAAPAVDYTYYFANFEARPRVQHLTLQLDLERERENLKILSDSKLSLRCSSTQAQLLQTDSSSVSIVLGYWSDLANGKPNRAGSNWRQVAGSSQQAKRQSQPGNSAPPRRAGGLAGSSLATILGLALVLIQQQQLSL